MRAAPPRTPGRPAHPYMKKHIKSIINKLGFHVEDVATTVIDVVCGMELPLKRAKHSREHNGELYYFCSQSCHSHFANDPHKYVGGE